MQCLSLLFQDEDEDITTIQPNNLTTTTRSRAYSIAALLLHLYTWVGEAAEHYSSPCKRELLANGT